MVAKAIPKAPTKAAPTKAPTKAAPTKAPPKSPPKSPPPKAKASGKTKPEMSDAEIKALWFASPNVNPTTGRAITTDGPVYKKLLKTYGDPFGAHGSL